MGINMNPIEESIEYLINCGYTEDQAKNLISALQADTPEILWDIAPKWIEHVGEHKKYQHCILDLVAMQMMTVSLDEKGEWLFRLNREKAIEQGFDLS
jgi:hypothetical protein